MKRDSRDKMSRPRLLSVLLSAGLLATLTASSSPSGVAYDEEGSLSELEWTLSQLPHSRSKRFLYLTEEKRLVLPPGTQLVLTPTLALPFLRYPPDGLDANMTISTPFTSECTGVAS